MTRQLMLDTETTGLSAEGGDRIVEIGIVELVNRRYTGNDRHIYLNAGRPSAPEALRVHGLTEEFLADKPTFRDISADLIEYLSGAEIVIHNAPFDVGFLDMELIRLGLRPLVSYVGRITDSMVMAKNMFPGKAKSLDALCRRFEVDNTNRTLHGARLDAGLLAEVFVRMTRGQESLTIDSRADHLLHSGDLEEIDFDAFPLVLAAPSADDLAAHESLLKDLDKAAGGSSIWSKLMTRQLEAA